MLRAGSTIGGMRIDELIGRGAMGEVYRAVQVSLKRPVAVKRIAEHLLGDPAAIARFEREAQCVARVQSPHVVAVHDFGRFRDEDGQEHYLLVMELVDGGKSLRALLGAPLDWRTAASLVRQVCEGLAAAAEFGVVHRDIKPDNIMVTRKGVAKLADFGLAKSVDSSAMTMEGTLLGTPNYMAPEACRGAEVDHRGDLYSLGATWFHLLTGRPPFQAANTMALLRSHIDDPPPEVRSPAAATPLAIGQLVMRCLAKQPQDRPASAQALADELSALASQGIVLPRTVPELLGAVAGEAQPTPLTKLPGPTDATLKSDPGTIATELPARTADAASSTRPPSPAADPGQAATAATVMAAPAPGSLATSINTPPAQSATMVPATALTRHASPLAPTPPPTSSSTLSTAAVAERRGRRAPVLAAVVGAVVSLVVIAWLIFGRDAKGLARRQVDEAIAAGDYGLALQRADHLLGEYPGDELATAAVKASIYAEVKSLIAQESWDTALKLIAERHQQRSWLNVDGWEKEVLIARATKAIKDGNSAQGAELFGALSKRFPKDLAIARAKIDGMSGDPREREAFDAAYLIAGSTSEPLAANVLKLLLDGLSYLGPFGSFEDEYRKLLVRRHPPVIESARANLTVADYELRINSYLLLKQAGKLSDTEELRYQLFTMTTLSSSYGITGEAVTWLAAAIAKPGWDELKKSAKVGRITGVLALNSWDEHELAVEHILVTGFLPEIQDSLVEWANTAEDEYLRYNAFRMLRDGKLSERIDVGAFHAKTLAIFNPLYDSKPFNEALDYFKARPGTAVTKAAFAASVAHIQHQIDLYDKAGMGSRARTSRERLAIVKQAAGQE